MIKDTEHKPILFFVILVSIFYFNHVLPFGLTLTLLLTPFFLFSLMRWRAFNLILLSGTILFLINIPHLILGVDIKTWLISNINLFSVLLFTLVAYILAKNKTVTPYHIQRLSILNAIGLAIALPLFFIPGLRSVFWYEIPFTPNHDVIPRLKMFTLEASHYSLLIVPLFLYYLLDQMRNVNLKKAILLITLIISLVCSFSLGVLFVLGVSVAILVILYIGSFLSHPKTRIFIGLGCIGFFVCILGLFIYYPENPLFFRIENVLSGVDTSGRGRTYEAFDIAWKVLEKTNRWVGIGIGQFKLEGRDTLINYYKYMNIPDVVRLPNTMAETLVTFGISGFIAKLLLQVILFFKTKVYRNIYQCSIFLFVFIYQFTGSYLVNSMEYLLWILAFVPIFPLFSTKKYFTP